MTEGETHIEAILSGTATSLEAAEFERRMSADPNLRREYVAQMKLHALLQWRSGQAAPVLHQKISEFPRARRHFPTLAMAAAMAIFCGIGALWWFRSPAMAPLVTVDVLHAAGVVIADGTAAPLQGERRKMRVVDLQAGLLRFRLDSGVIVGAQGPAKIELLSAMHIRVIDGRITADAGEAHGFTVETSRAKVVDLGTRFGVESSASGTDVVVFDGAVELHDSTQKDAAPQRLEQGEAVRMGSVGGAQALVSIAAGVEPEQWTSGGGGIFRAVRDNRRVPSSLKFYQVVPGGLREDSRAYVDRVHEWNGLDRAGLPPELLGADLVRPFNDDKRETGLEITLELSRPATIYLFLDEKPAPAWVAQAGFVDAGFKIGLDEGPSPNRQLTTDTGPGVSLDRVFSVWKMEVREARAIQLGAPREGPTRAKAMYGIAAKPLEVK